MLGFDGSATPRQAAMARQRQDERKRASLTRAVYNCLQRKRSRSSKPEGKQMRLTILISLDVLSVDETLGLVSSGLDWRLQAQTTHLSIGVAKEQRPQCVVRYEPSSYISQIATEATRMSYEYPSSQHGEDRQDMLQESHCLNPRPWTQGQSYYELRCSTFSTLLQHAATSAFPLFKE